VVYRKENLCLLTIIEASTLRVKRKGKSVTVDSHRGSFLRRQPRMSLVHTPYHIGMFTGTCIQILRRCKLLLTFACCACLQFVLVLLPLVTLHVFSKVCVYHLGSEFQDAGGKSREHSGSPTLQHSHSDLSPHHSLDSASMSPVFANYLQQQQVQIQRQNQRLRAHLHCLVFDTSDMTCAVH